MVTSALDAKPKVTAERSEYYQRLSARNAAPLWEVLAALVTPQPRPVCVPALWRYSEMRELLMETSSSFSNTPELTLGVEMTPSWCEIVPSSRDVSFKISSGSALAWI